ncbi:alpha-glucan family phosphorylase [Dehalogenimonas sp. THU2]|uniref:alpha-glucan family phosphorylase n=1 Tax=Dehalogenimonas sp. THU2 TaxID=3151121 RepID=UPI003218BC3F
MNVNDLLSRLPERIKRLAELSANLWWSWHLPAREMFDTIDRRLWRSTGHNPVRMLYELNSDRLERLATNQDFLAVYDTVMAAYDTELTDGRHWLSRTYPEAMTSPVAYFSMEFAVHNSLPMYAGGLGVLAGDICKESSDLGIPFVGIGFMYPEGYFHQRISSDGWQVEHYRQLDFERAPISRVTTPDGDRFLLNLPLGEKTVFLTAWRVLVGRSILILLDTNVPENTPEDQGLSARLYSAGREIRLQQEYLLGVGGVRVLRALGIEPAVWHCNEGHTSFLLLERVREFMAAGDEMVVAVTKVKATSVFTTHTPVPAGHDTFDRALMERYFCCFWQSLKVAPETFLSLGQAGPDEPFNMTVLGLKLSDKTNGVSELHGEVSRRMWRRLYPDKAEADIPIDYVTNGVHIPTWVGPELARLYERHIGPDWYNRQDEKELWRSVGNIPDEELWRVHHGRKQRLIHYIRERVRREWNGGEESGQRLVALGGMLDPEVLTIGFVRRFVEYKRPTLLFRDIERLKNLIRNWQRPVQFIFAGKSHPADFMAKELIHRVYNQATDKEFEGRLCFVEDYDLHMAHYLVQGVDVWLNNPRRLLEASGTSGMKAAVNGVPNLSVRDGWWHEGFNGRNGWAIGDINKADNVADEDALDAGALYYVLEEMILPMYYDRDLGDIPRKWLQVVKQSIGSVLPQFTASRMMKEYAEKMYLPIVKKAGSPDLGGINTTAYR